MNQATPEILVCHEGLNVCVRISGRADVSVSPGVRDLLAQLRERGFEHYELDLTGCQIMDSTFLGVLCGFAQRHEADQPDADRRPILFNANLRISGLLTNLGVDEMFEFREGQPPDRGPCEPAATPIGKPGRRELTATSLEAHRTLMSLNPDNLAKFKDLTGFLADDLKRIRSNR